MCSPPIDRVWLQFVVPLKSTRMIWTTYLFPWWMWWKSSGFCGCPWPLDYICRDFKLCLPSLNHCILQRHVNFDQTNSGARKWMRWITQLKQWCLIMMYNGITYYRILIPLYLRCDMIFFTLGPLPWSNVILRPGGSRRWNSASRGKGNESIRSRNIGGGAHVAEVCVCVCVFFLIGWCVFSWQGAFWLKWFAGLGRY